MLDAYIIEEIKKRERAREGARPRLRIEIERPDDRTDEERPDDPLRDEEEEEEEEEEDSEPGVIKIRLT